MVGSGLSCVPIILDTHTVSSDSAKRDFPGVDVAESHDLAEGEMPYVSFFF